MTSPAKNKKRLLVLCCHQPSLDPRIGWSANFGKENGYDVRVMGFSHVAKGQIKHKGPKPNIPENIFTPEHPSLKLRNILMLMLGSGIVPRGRDLAIWTLPFLISLPFILVFLGFKILVRGLRAVYLSVRHLPKGQAVLNYSALYYRRYLQTLVLKIKQIPRNIWRFVSGGRFRPLIEALRGYRWYFRDHMAGFAACVLFDVEQNGYIPDIIHAHDPDSLLAASLLKAKYGCRLIYDAHEYGPDAYLLWPRPRYLFFALERMLFKHVDAAVTVSPGLAEKFNARFPRLDFLVLPNASPRKDGEFEVPKKSDIKKLAQGRVSVLFQGGFAKHRGVEWVIDEWAKLNPKNAALFIRGPNNVFRKQLINHAHGTGLLNQSIYFLDSIGEDKLIAYASTADIGIIPYHSYVENHAGACPNKLSQYMLAGLAIISTPLPNVESIIELASCGVIYDDKKAGDFGRALSLLLASPAKIAVHGKAGRNYALNEYNYGHFAHILLDIYEK
ncbi:MAG: glycosyltransferase [Robiginitomaculum sp.]|nr:glycosyltransferase [Robiginitomaculum sp.]